MKELSSKEQVSLANILKESFDGGDWQELMINAECEFYDISQLLRDVQWGNDTLKQNSINAVRFVLSKDPYNLKHIWDIEVTQNRLKEDLLSYMKRYTLLLKIFQLLKRLQKRIVLRLPTGYLEMLKIQ